MLGYFDASSGQLSSLATNTQKTHWGDAGKSERGNQSPLTNFDGNARPLDHESVHSEDFKFRMKVAWRWGGW